MDDINIFDIIVITLITLLGLKGLFRGFIKEFFALFGIVGGVFVASRLSAQVGEMVDTIIPFDNNNTMMLVGFIVALIIFWILAYGIGIVLSKVFSLSGLGIFDKALGFVFGASKVFLLFSMIAFAISSIESIAKKLDVKLADSIVYPMLKDTGAYIIKLDTTQLENGVTKHVNSAIETTKDALEDISTDAIKDKVEEIQNNIQNTKE